MEDDDLIEKILVRSDVKALIRFKSVCKPWRSLISSPRFIKRHFQHNYKKDRYNNHLNNRRITAVVDASAHYHFVGSTNGLVCLIYYSGEVLVGNPLTREVRKLRAISASDGSPVCRGFGYDSTKDDYKVVLGFLDFKNREYAKVLSLKSNVWRLIGIEKRRFINPNGRIQWITKDGILCNGVLHWIARDSTNENIVIIAFDLSKEEFREIPQPKDERYEFTSESRLAVIKECLCIYTRSFLFVDAWVLKDYNVKQSWELMQYNQEMKYDIVHYMRASNEYCIPSDSLLRVDDESRSNRTLGYIDAPVFVQSLLSPYVNGKPIQKNKSDKRSLPYPNERPKRPVRSCRLVKGSNV